VKLFGTAPHKVRVVQMETGGGFGGKEEYPSLIAAHAALLARKSGRPVKLIYDRAEDMAATTKRHPSRTRHRTVVDRDGRLVAMDIEFLLDGGAYCTLSPVVLSRGTIHAPVRTSARTCACARRRVATNTPPHGAFRGFGAPQSLFALERHMDVVAKAVGLSPEEFRRRNFIQQGQTSAVGQVMREAPNMDRLLSAALELSDYHAKVAKFAAAIRAEREEGNGLRDLHARRRFHGIWRGSPGVGCRGRGDAEGRVRVLAASTEIGQGTNTIFTQIAADALGIDLGDIEIIQPDTGVVPNSGPTVASRTCMVVGHLVEKACGESRRALDLARPRAEQLHRDEFRRACRLHFDAAGPLRGSSRYEPPPGIHWDDETYQGDAYGAYAWAVYVAEVSVDTITGETKVDDFVALQEVGRVIHPVLAAAKSKAAWPRPSATRSTNMSSGATAAWRTRR
jgi:CO/xanthine dehydrogenase Mo-binding subunit